MPYELSFTKQFEYTNSGEYINECCVGGDQVIDQFLHQLRKEYSELQTNQKDWGWFVWFSKAGTEFAVDVFCDNPVAGEFRIHLTSRVPRMILGRRVADMPELERLRDIVVDAMESWMGVQPRITHLDAKYMPTENAT